MSYTKSPAALQRATGLFACQKFHTPALVYGDIETQDLGKLGDYIQKMTGIGVLQPDEGLEDFVRQQAGLPERLDEYTEPNMTPPHRAQGEENTQDVQDTASEASAAKKAQEAALKYAARQHRARADMIANTELAFAYNRGENMSIRNAMREGLMGACVKIWRTAGSERVCPRCGALNGKRIGFDESFDIGGREMFPGMHETPPAHPRCRCVVQYKEIAAPARGLRSGEGQRKASDHPVPQELGRIDFTDKNMVQSTIEHFESQIVAQKVENAIVITQEGRVVRCVGHLNGVYPDEDIGDELRGAVVTHNHPAGSANEWSFSKADIDLFTLYGLSVLRGIDEQYVYELNRNPQDIDKVATFAEAGEFAFRHSMVIQEAKHRGFGYRRWKR